MSSSRSNGGEAIPALQSEGATLPLIDLSLLNRDEIEHERCVKEMVEAASEWGFFQIVNHGVPEEILETTYHEGKSVFDFPFSEKTRERFLNLSANSYRWGNPNATSPSQFSWSEALQISLAEIQSLPDGNNNLRGTLEAYVQETRTLAQTLCELLGKQVNVKPSYFEEICEPGNSCIRFNKYPPRSTLASQVFGLVPHTDSDLLTVLYQDQIGGLELKKDGRWIAIKPRPDALIVNIGDLFQALSNGVYKSVEHRVVSSRGTERLSIAFFFSPNQETEIECCGNPKLYRKFSFREYKEQIARDVAATGDKVGLSRFLQATYTKAMSPNIV